MDKKLINIKGIKTRKNAILPIWDARIIYYESELYGSTYIFENEPTYDLVNLVFNIETKEISEGITIEIYPDKTEFNVGDEILVEQSYHNLALKKVVDIKYEEFDIENFLCTEDNIKDSYYRKFDIQVGLVYCFKKWKPTYVFEDGTSESYIYKFYKLTK